jgi:hypothetical protein
MDLPAVHLNEAQFRLALNEDAMASDKLAEGIRAFCADVKKLEPHLLVVKQQSTQDSWVTMNLILQALQLESLMPTYNWVQSV